MKLKRVRIENYRSIVDCGTVEIEEGVTVVIGKNEQGKSTFLKAIQAFNSDQKFSPNDLYPEIRTGIN
jgi:predicted ATP-dependent endonuclease of OLD family